MKNFLRNSVFISVVVFTITLFTAQNINAQVYSTRANGNWNSLSTWAGGLVPPSGLILFTMTININHSVTYNSGIDINNYGTIRLVKTTSNIPVLTIPSGVKLDNFSSGKIYIKDAEYRQYRFAGGGNSGTALSGSFTNKGGYVEILNSIVEVAQDWKNENSGVRVFKKGLLLTGRDYEVKDNNTIDTLDKVAVSIGWHNNGDFKINSGKIVFNQAKIQLAGSNSAFDFNSGNGRGDIDYITYKNHITSTVNTGDLKVSSSVNTGGLLNLDAYCVSDPSKYKVNGMCSGSQSLDCSMNYFPSSFMIQQANNLSAGLGFTNPQPVGAMSLGVGAKYKFASVNDSTDAIVTIDSLINGATVATIDDNTVGVGHAISFQPRIGSGNLIGTSYAVFTISFVKTGTSTPVSLQSINATVVDIDGNATLKEFGEVTMGDGTGMDYMSSSIDIALLPLPAGSFGAKNILGIERDNIDTVSYNNMFTVFNTDMSSFRVKLGTITSSPTTSVRQFSVYMRGFAYELYTLPVKLSAFTAVLQNNNKVDLKWSTSTESNLSHFIVERSTDGTNYSDAGMVFATGNTSSRSDYSLTDNITGMGGVIYYRLRSIDEDGKFLYSDVRIIRVGKNENNITILTYPNPVSTELRITIPAEWQNKKVLYEIFNSNGTVARKSEAASAGQTETINVSTLAAGYYLVRVSCNGQSAQQKIIKH